MTHILLTGAGFSRNWGGYLANEAFEYLLGSIHVDDRLRRRLWAGKEGRLGFEDILSQLQNAHRHGSFDAQLEEDLRNMTNAVNAMFADMAAAFEHTHFKGPRLSAVTDIVTFLREFDAIYTLNQDTLLEQKYLTEPGSTTAIPGIEEAGFAIQINGRNFSLKKPLKGNYDAKMGVQPYLKLHGSFNWIDDDQSLLVIIGGDKPAAIDKYPVLKSYHSRFQADLEKPDARLMVIGYSFSDDHINRTIIDAIGKNNNLRIFIVDPKGVDILDKRDPRAEIPQPLDEAPLLRAVGPHIIGASRRPLSSTFGADLVENSRLMRFFNR